MTLLLDSDIRDWVVLPLFVIMVATGLLRHYVSLLLKNDPTPIPKVQMRIQSMLRHTSKLKSGASNYICSWKWHIRRNHYVKLLQDEAEWVIEDAKKAEEGDPDDPDGSQSNAAAANDPMQQMMNPMSMMKGNMVFMVQNMVMMQGISHFFSGFILLKIPFPLTVGFKPMFQRGLYDLPSLESSYVSSVSWYFLVMFGLRSFFRLAIGDMAYEQRETAKLQSKFGYNVSGNPMAQTPDAAQHAKNLRQEAENIEYFLQVPNKAQSIDSVEKRLLGSRYPKKSKAYGAGTTPGGIASTIATDTFMKKKKKR